MNQAQQEYSNAGHHFTSGTLTSAAAGEGTASLATSAPNPLTLSVLPEAVAGLLAALYSCERFPNLEAAEGARKLLTVVQMAAMHASTYASLHLMEQPQYVRERQTVFPVP
jgi:hypothetical protein